MTDLVEGATGLEAAERIARHDLARLNYPPANWVPERNGHRREGPWNTTARMPILRSPKHLTGPDLGVPSLTFRAWYEAQHGSDGWEKLYKVLRLDWMDYLVWGGKVVGL